MAGPINPYREPLLAGVAESASAGHAPTKSLTTRPNKQPVSHRTVDSVDKTKQTAFATKMTMSHKSPITQRALSAAPRASSLSRVDEAPAPVEAEECDEPRLVPLRQLMSASMSSGSDERGEGKGDESKEILTSVRSVPTPTQALHELAIFKGLDPALRDILIQKGTTQTLSEGTQIVREGETPNALVSFLRGTGKLFFTAGNGRVGHARIVFAPTSIGHHEIATQQPLQASLKLIEKSTLWVLPAIDLRRAMATSPRLQENVLAETASELREMSELARALLFDDTASRLAQMMLKFAQMRGLPGQEGTIIPIALTQQDFAEALGVDLRSINRVMVEWFGARLIVKSEKRFVIVDAAKLSEIALQFRPK